MSDDKEFDGVTWKDCCDACNSKRCVITGSPFCGHPHKASHPGATDKVRERIVRVKRIIALQKAAGAAA